MMLLCGVATKNEAFVCKALLVAPGEGAIMAAPYGAMAPRLDGSEVARSL